MAVFNNKSEYLCFSGLWFGLVCSLSFEGGLLFGLGGFVDNRRRNLRTKRYKSNPSSKKSYPIYFKCLGFPESSDMR